MPKSKEYSVEECTRILGMVDEGQNPTEVARQLKIAKRS